MQMRQLLTTLISWPILMLMVINGLQWPSLAHHIHHSTSCLAKFSVCNVQYLMDVDPARLTMKTCFLDYFGVEHAFPELISKNLLNVACIKYNFYGCHIFARAA